MAKSDQKERRRVSARRMVEEHDSGHNNKALKIPAGFKLRRIKKEDVYRWDFLPYEVKADHNPHADKGSLGFERIYFVHKNIGPNEATVTCLAKTFGDPCPICEHRAKIAREGASKDALKALQPSERQLFIIVDTEAKKEEIEIFDHSEWLFGKYLREKIEKADPGDDYEAFADLQDGQTLKISAKEVKGPGYSWYDCANIEFKKRTREYPESILSKVPDLDECVVRPTYEEVDELFFKGTDRDEDDKDDGKTPSRLSKDKEDVQEPPSRVRKDKDDEDDEDKRPARGKDKEDEDKDDKDGDVAVGDTVEFEYKGKTRRGIVKEIDEKNELIRVKCDDRDAPYNVEPDDVTKVEPEPEKEPEKEEKKPARGKKTTAAKEEKTEAASFTPKVGAMVVHKKLGECEIVKIKGEVVTLEDSETELHGGIPLSECSPVKKK